MKKIQFLGLLLIFTAATANSPQWYSSWNEAVEQSTLLEKPILMVFSGSDWCKPCMMLDKTVFDSPDFQEYAAKNLILLKVDFPRQKKNRLSETQRMHNEELAKKYNPNGEFPLVLLLNTQGELISQINHSPKSSEEFIRLTQQLLTSQK